MVVGKTFVSISSFEGMFTDMNGSVKISVNKLVDLFSMSNATFL